MSNLDLKDKKILLELEQNARESLQQIGKSVGLSKEVVFHRIKNLEKEGIIKKYITEINLFKIGYQLCPILLKFQDTTPRIELEIYHFLKNNKQTAWLTKCDGSWDINLTLVTKNNVQVGLFLEELNSKYGRFIANKELFVTKEIFYFKRDYGLKNDNQFISMKNNESLYYDNLELLRILNENARIPLIDVNKKLKIHPKTIANKIKLLEKEKIIQGYRAFIDYRKLGLKFYKIWFALKSEDPKNIKKLFSYFKQENRIRWATRLIGSYDLSIEIEVKDENGLRSILEEIKTKFSDLIRKHESLLILEESELNYLEK